MLFYFILGANMIKYLLIVVFLLSVHLKASSEFPYEIYRGLLPNISGVVEGKDHLLIYGGNGILGISADNGENWQPVYLGDSNDIKKVIFHQEAFYAVSDYYLFKSTNNGFSWKSKTLNNSSFDYIVKEFDIIDEKIYVPIKNGVNVFDLELNYLPLDYIEFGNENLNGHIKFFNNLMILSKSESSILKFDRITNKIEDINLLDYDQCDTCQGINGFQEFDNKIYVRYNNKLFEIKEDILSLKATGIDGPFWIDQGEVYLFGSFVRDSIPLYTPFGILDLKKYSFCIFKINENDTKEFVYKDNNLYSIGIKPIYINNMMSNNKILAVLASQGLISFDFINKEFKVLSYLTGTVLNLINQNYFFGSSSQMSIADENFVKFKPIGSGLEFEEPSFLDSYSLLSSKGIGIGNMGKGSAENEIEYLYKTFDFGKTFEKYKEIDLKPLSTGLVSGFVFNEFFYLVHSFVGRYQRASSIRIIDPDLASYNMIRFDSLGVLSCVPDTDSSLSIVAFDVRGNISQNANFNSFNDVFFRIMKSFDGGITWRDVLNQKINIDGSNFNLSDYKVNLHTNKSIVVNRYRADNDKIPNQAYIFDFNRNVVDSLPTNSLIPTLPLTFYNDKYYMVYSPDGTNESTQYVAEFDYITNDISKAQIYYVGDLSQRFKDASKNAGAPQIGDTYLHSLNVTSLGLVLNIRKVESDRVKGDVLFLNTENYLLRPKTPSSVENAETETPRSRAFLHAGKPYPLPAVSTVSADLHWNAQYSASEAVLKVFDSMGNEIPNAKVELQQTNPYSGTVTWDCGTYPTGVYFIQVTIGTEQTNVGVAVVR